MLRRLNEFRSKAGDLPDSFHQIATDLPLLIRTLDITKDGIDRGQVDEKTELALSPVITACQKQVEALDQLLERILPTGDSWRNKTVAALKSVLKESNVEKKKIQSAIKGHLDALTHYHTASLSTGQAQKGRILLCALLRPPYLRQQHSTHNSMCCSLRYSSLTISPPFFFFLEGILTDFMSDDTLPKIQKWLSAAPDPYVNHNKAFKQCLPDTGRWFLDGS